MLLAVLTVFNGCQKDEPVLVDEQLQEVVKPDVYAENGYLVFRDMNAVNSVIKMLDKMNLVEKEAWEVSLGFESASRYYAPIFKEAESFNTVDEMIHFKNKYENILRFEQSEGVFAFDYPYCYLHYVSVMNKDGVLKIGKSIIKYDADVKIIIPDGNEQMLKALLNEGKIEKDFIVIEKNDILKSTNSIFITNFVHSYPASYIDGSYFKWSSSRRMETELQWEKYVYLGLNNFWIAGYNILLWQHAQKKSLGIWVNYNTQYLLSGTYGENNIPLIAHGTYTSPEVKPSHTFLISQRVTSQTSFQPSLSTISRTVPAYFVGTTSCRGFDSYPVQISYYD